jgi:hypothetical protein
MNFIFELINKNLKDLVEKNFTSFVSKIGNDLKKMGV